MDWFSWLSRTNLDPCLIYQYGLVLSRNELQHEDISYFNHEFLLSMGISIAKHRLEILKLAAKESSNRNSHTIRFSRFISAVKKCVNRFVSNHNSSLKPLPAPEPVPVSMPPLRLKQQPWKDLPVIRNRRQAKSGPLVIPRNNVMVNHRRLKLSGPLDGRVPESLMFDDRKLKLSGPLDGNSHDRLVFSYRSPKLYAGSDINQRLMAPPKSPARVAKPLDCNNMEKSRKSNDDDLDDKLLWAALFQDMNPT
ncbi:Sterile alpha motif (SAM) domain-containing protein [Euphorbia peplus]|nr:Sterile alpha motif (SAM) domain-containing protein [Euphorbia peplus]